MQWDWERDSAWLWVSTLSISGAPQAPNKSDSRLTWTLEHGGLRVRMRVRIQNFIACNYKYDYLPFAHYFILRSFSLRIPSKRYNYKTCTCLILLLGVLASAGSGTAIASGTWHYPARVPRMLSFFSAFASESSERID